MANPHLTSLKSASRKKTAWSFSLSRFGRRRQLIISVLAVYFIVGGLIGYSLWNTNGESAKASENALISSSIRLNEDKEYAVGDSISLTVTLQNTSVVESINSVALDLFSTNSAVTWSNLVGGNIRSADLSNDNRKNSFKLPVLSSGERVEYVATGKIDKVDTEYLTILGKVRFLNKTGLQESSTNRVFTKLQNSGAKIGRSLELSLVEPKINSNSKASFNLKWPEGTVNPKTLSGKVYLSDRNSLNVVASQDCEVTSDSCSGEFSSLLPGDYSLLFVDSNEEVYSNIGSLTVVGQSQDFTPSGLVSLSFPFGSVSIDGVVPVIAKKVVSLNNSLKATDQCTFRVSANGQNTDIKTPVRQDRSCYAEILTSQIPSGEGVYKVGLLGSSQEQSVSFLKKPVNTIPLENQTVLPAKGQPIQIKSTGLVDSSNVTLDNVNVTLGVFNPSTASYKEYNSINGQVLKVVGGTFSSTIPADVFTQGGFYNLYIKLETGQISDFTGVNFNDSEIGVNTSGVRIENENDLKAGRSMTFTVSNITDRSGALVGNGDCSAVIYSTSLNSQGLEVKGSLNQGVCKVVTQGNQLVQSGPALISFPEYSQSRQFNIFTNTASSFGNLKMEYEPAQQNFANTLIIGPVTDNFGNLSSVFGMKIEVLRSNQSVQTIQPVDVIDGFAKVILPASVFSEDNVEIKASTSDGNVILDQTFNVVNSNKLVLPNIPKELNGDSRLKISLGGFEDKIEVCNFQFIKSDSENISNSVPYDADKKSCNLDWNLNQLRNTKNALIKINAGDKTFNSVIALTSGDAGNIFALGASNRVSSNEELDYVVLTSPVLDKFGLPVTKGNLRLTYNGKVADVEIKNGLASLHLSANKLDNNDLRNVLGGKILELAIDAKASPVSISRTNTITSFLGSYDISNIPEEISLLEGSTFIPAGSVQIFTFKSDKCLVRQLSDRQDSSILLSHWQGGVCYVEVGGNVGNYTLQLLDGNFVLKEFKYLVTSSNDSVLWCDGDTGCVVQVLASTLGNPEAVIFDGERQYKFQASNTDNSINLKQDSLNPLKKYSVQVGFINQNNQEVVYYHQISGSRLIGK